LKTWLKKTAKKESLKYHIFYEDIFDATVNSQEAVDMLISSAEKSPVNLIQKPFCFSEDIGKFLKLAPGALIGLGAGEDKPDLHNPDYDFPNELIPAGVDIFMGLVRECLG